MDGLEETGVTIMKLNEGMDTGPTLSTATIPITADDTTGSMAEKLSALGAELIVAALGEIEAGTAVFVPQDDNQASHAAMLKKEDGLVPWAAAAEEVSCRMRGVDPWPGAFTYLEGQRIRLFRPTVSNGEGEPGEIVSITDEGIEVACGKGSVFVEELQAPGKKRMDAAAFARGRGLLGSRLSSVEE
jgi:methionyl-tRNA formyltransferase